MDSTHVEQQGFENPVEGPGVRSKALRAINLGPYPSEAIEGLRTAEIAPAAIVHVGDEFEPDKRDPAREEIEPRGRAMIYHMPTHTVYVAPYDMHHGGVHRYIEQTTGDTERRNRYEGELEDPDFVHWYREPGNWKHITNQMGQQAPAEFDFESSTRVATTAPGFTPWTPESRMHGKFMIMPDGEVHHWATGDGSDDRPHHGDYLTAIGRQDEYYQASEDDDPNWTPGWIEPSGAAETLKGHKPRLPLLFDAVPGTHAHDGLFNFEPVTVGGRDASRNAADSDQRGESFQQIRDPMSGPAASFGQACPMCSNMISRDNTCHRCGYDWSHAHGVQFGNDTAYLAATGAEGEMFPPHVKYYPTGAQPRVNQENSFWYHPQHGVVTGPEHLHHADLADYMRGEYGNPWHDPEWKQVYHNEGTLEGSPMPRRAVQKILGWNDDGDDRFDFEAMVKEAPFKSPEQRAYMHIHHPEIAERWEEEYKDDPVQPGKKKKKGAGVSVIDHGINPGWDNGYKGRRPVLYMRGDDKVHVGGDSETHFEFSQRAGLSYDSHRLHQGWLGLNPKSDDEDPTINYGEPNEYGWYGERPGAHVDQALAEHFNAHAPQHTDSEGQPIERYDFLGKMAAGEWDFESYEPDAETNQVGHRWTMRNDGTVFSDLAANGYHQDLREKSGMDYEGMDEIANGAVSPEGDVEMYHGPQDKVDHITKQLQEQIDMPLTFRPGYDFGWKIATALYDFEGIGGHNEPKPHPELPDEPHWDGSDDDTDQWRYAVHNDGTLHTWPDETHAMHFMGEHSFPDDFKDFGMWEPDDPEESYGPGSWKSYVTTPDYTQWSGQPNALKDTQEFYRGLRPRDYQQGEGDGRQSVRLQGSNQGDGQRTIPRHHAKRDEDNGGRGRRQADSNDHLRGRNVDEAGKLAAGDFDFESPYPKITHKAVMLNTGEPRVWPQRYFDEAEMGGRSIGWAHANHLQEEDRNSDEVAHFFDIYDNGKVEHAGPGLQTRGITPYMAQQAVEQAYRARTASEWNRKDWADGKHGDVFIEMPNGQRLWGAPNHTYHAEVAKHHGLTPEQASTGLFGGVNHSTGELEYYTHSPVDTANRVMDESNLWQEAGHQFDFEHYGKTASVVEVEHPLRERSEDEGRPYIYDSKAGHVYLGQPHGIHWDMINHTPALADQYHLDPEAPPAGLPGMVYGRAYDNGESVNLHHIIGDPVDNGHEERVRQMLEAHLGKPVEGGDISDVWDFPHTWDFEARTAAGPMLRGVVMPDGQVHSWDTAQTGEYHADWLGRHGLDLNKDIATAWRMSPTNNEVEIDRHPQQHFPAVAEHLQREHGVSPQLWQPQEQWEMLSAAQVVPMYGSVEDGAPVIEYESKQFIGFPGQDHFSLGNELGLGYPVGRPGIVDDGHIEWHDANAYNFEARVASRQGGFMWADSKGNVYGKGGELWEPWPNDKEAALHWDTHNQWAEVRHGPLHEVEPSTDTIEAYLPPDGPVSRIAEAYGLAALDDAWQNPEAYKHRQAVKQTYLTSSPNLPQQLDTLRTPQSPMNTGKALSPLSLSPPSPHSGTLHGGTAAPLAALSSFLRARAIKEDGLHYHEAIEAKDGRERGHCSTLTCSGTSACTAHTQPEAPAGGWERWDTALAHAAAYVKGSTHAQAGALADNRPSVKEFLSHESIREGIDFLDAEFRGELYHNAAAQGSDWKGYVHLPTGEVIHWNDPNLHHTPMAEQHGHDYSDVSTFYGSHDGVIIGPRGWPLLKAKFPEIKRYDPSQQIYDFERGSHKDASAPPSDESPFAVTVRTMRRDDYSEKEIQDWWDYLAEHNEADRDSGELDDVPDEQVERWHENWETEGRPSVFGSHKESSDAKGMWDFNTPDPNAWSHKALKLKDGRGISGDARQFPSHFHLMEEHGITPDMVADYGGLADGQYYSLAHESDDGQWYEQNWPMRNGIMRDAEGPYWGSRTSGYQTPPGPDFRPFDPSQPGKATVHGPTGKIFAWGAPAGMLSDEDPHHQDAHMGLEHSHGLEPYTYHGLEPDGSNNKSSNWGDYWYDPQDGLEAFGQHARNHLPAVTQALSVGQADPDQFDFEKFATGPRREVPIPDVHEIVGGDPLDAGGWEEDGGWGDRRPLVYHPESNKLFVGDLDVSHGDVIKAAQKQGLAPSDIPYNRNGVGVGHGWIGPNPENHDLRPGPEGYAIKNTGEPNEYGWYTPLPPEHAKAVTQALHQHFNAAEEEPFYDFEHFGKAASNWNVIPGSVTPENSYHDEPGVTYDHHPVIVDKNRGAIYTGAQGTHHVDLQHEFPNAQGSKHLLYPHDHVPGAFAYWSGWEREADPTVVDALANHYGYKILPSEEYNFESKTADAMSDQYFKTFAPPEENDYEMEDWERGFPGKAVVFKDGDVWSWKTDEKGSPHHWDIAGPEQGYKRGSVRSYHDIRPDGTVMPETQGHEDADLVAKYIGGQPEHGWDFDDYDLPNEYRATWEPLDGPDPFSAKGDALNEINRRTLYDNDEYQYGEQPMQWQPGQSGKGIFHGDEPISWAVDKFGSPHHEDVAAMRDPTEETPINGYFHISPQGTVEPEGQNAVNNLDRFLGHDSRLKSHDGLWDFEKYAAEDSAWDVRQVSEPYAGNMDILGDRIPVLYSPAHHRIQDIVGADKINPVHQDRLYIGAPGWTHPQMEHELGVMRSGVAPEGAEYYPATGEFRWQQWMSDPPRGHEDVVDYLRRNHWPDMDYKRDKRFDFEGKVAAGMAQDLFTCSTCGSHAMAEPTQLAPGNWTQLCTRCKRSRRVDPSHPFIKALQSQTGYPQALQDLNGLRPMNVFGSDTSREKDERDHSAGDKGVSQPWVHEGGDKPRPREANSGGEKNESQHLDREDKGGNEQPQGEPKEEHEFMTGQLEPDVQVEAAEKEHHSNPPHKGRRTIRDVLGLLWEGSNGEIVRDQHREGHGARGPEGNLSSHTQRIADIDWERNERPYVPAMDDNPQSTTHVVIPEGFNHEQAKHERVPFWVLEHPERENTYATILGHPGTEHAFIHDMHDPGFQEWPLAYSGGIWPGGSGKMGPGGTRTFDKDTIEFYNNFLRDPLGHYNEYDEPAHFHDAEYYKDHPNEVTPEFLETERKLDDHRKKSDSVRGSVEDAIMRHMQGKPYNFAKGDALAPDEYDFERYGAMDFDTDDFQNKLDSELRDPQQLVPWVPGTEAKGILHRDGDITSWQNPYIHHQDVEQFLREQYGGILPPEKRTDIFLDHISPSGEVLLDGDYGPALYDKLRAKGFKPAGIANHQFDFKPEDDYVGLNG